MKHFGIDLVMFSEMYLQLPCRYKEPSSKRGPVVEALKGPPPLDIFDRFIIVPLCHF